MAILGTHSRMRRTWSWPAAVGLALVTGLVATANGSKFYADDPITKVVDSQDASGVQEREIDLIYDTLENSFVWRGDTTPDVRAQNVNTVDEVPDSNWFTNRMGAQGLHGRGITQGG